MMKFSQDQRMKLTTTKRILEALEAYIKNLLQIVEESAWFDWFNAKYISLSFSIKSNLGLLEIPPSWIIKDDQVQPMPHEKSIMDALIGRCQIFHTSHAHPKGNYASLLRASVHNFKHLQHFRFRCCWIRRSQGLLSYDRQLHLTYVHADYMEHDWTFDPLFDVVFILC